MDGEREGRGAGRPGANGDEPAADGRDREPGTPGSVAAAGLPPAGGDDAVLVYVPAANAGEARRIGRKAVEERLAACANVFPHIDSFYWWQGELVEDHEAVVLLKTRRARVPELIAAVRAWHSYTVPAILVLEVRDGNPDYLRWLNEETGGAVPGGSGPAAAAPAGDVPPEGGPGASPVRCGRDV